MIENDEYELEPEYYLKYPGESPMNMLEDSWFTAMSVSLDPNKKPLYILGQAFLSKYYNVYDFENYRVGFGLANHDK